MLLLATVIGFSNFGSRSKNLDLESNCILIFNDLMVGGGTGWLKKLVAAKWNKLCRPSVELRDVCIDKDDGNRVMRVALKIN